jgi:hypothetical protein
MLSRLFIFSMESISNQHVDSVESIYCRAAAAFTSISFEKVCMEVVLCGPRADDELLAEYPVGRLGFRNFLFHSQRP